MPKTIDLRDASRRDWHASVSDASKSDYPGDMNIQLGCLMRIADASEKSALSHQRLIDERDRYKRMYEENERELNELRLSHRALRGVITRMQKKKANGAK